MKAWVTGGSSGIGYAVAAQLAARRLEVTTISRRGNAPPGCSSFKTDLAAEDLAERVAMLRGGCGFPDWAVLAAGMGAFVGMWDVTRQRVRELEAVNLEGPLVLAAWLTREARRARRPLRLVLVTSTCARAGGHGLGLYAATKAAIEAWVRCEGPGQAKKGVDVMAVAPGWVESPMTTALRPEIRAAALRRSPEGRFATAEECADFIVGVLEDRERFHGGDVVPFWAPTGPSLVAPVPLPAPVPDVVVRGGRSL
jgi:3-oxoacyl-[acyl-carrier protein] reductase